MVARPKLKSLNLLSGLPVTSNLWGRVFSPPLPPSLRSGSWMKSGALFILRADNDLDQGG
jgi:hypothetical protein